MDIELLITDRTAVKDPCYYELTDHDHDKWHAPKKINSAT
jgi:hypothetical protein